MLAANNRDVSDDSKLAKFFRSFELSTEYREIMYAREPIFKNLPQLLKGVIEYQFLDYYFARVPTWRLRLRKLQSKNRIAPNYIMTGPMKNGSCDLVSHLLMHPNVMHPLAKEIKEVRMGRDWSMYYPTEREKQRVGRVLR